MTSMTGFATSTGGVGRRQHQRHGQGREPPFLDFQVRAPSMLAAWKRSCGPSAEHARAGPRRAHGHGAAAAAAGRGRVERSAAGRPRRRVRPRGGVDLVWVSWRRATCSGCPRPSRFASRARPARPMCRSGRAGRAGEAVARGSGCARRDAATGGGVPPRGPRGAPAGARGDSRSWRAPPTRGAPTWRRGWRNGSRELASTRASSRAIAQGIVRTAGGRTSPRRWSGSAGISGTGRLAEARNPAAESSTSSCRR